MITQSNPARRIRHQLNFVSRQRVWRRFLRWLDRTSPPHERRVLLQLRLVQWLNYRWPTSEHIRVRRIA